MVYFTYVPDKLFNILYLTSRQNKLPPKKNLNVSNGDTMFSTDTDVYWYEHDCDPPLRGAQICRDSSYGDTDKHDCRRRSYGADVTHQESNGSEKAHANFKYRRNRQRSLQLKHNER